MADGSGRSARIEARVTPHTLAAVRRAAEIQGRSISDFVVTAAQEAAERAIRDAEVIKIAIEDHERIFNLLMSPPEPNAAMKRAIKAHSRLIRSSE